MKRCLKILSLGISLFAFTAQAVPVNPAEISGNTADVSASAASACTSDANCNYNGMCDTVTGKCFCSSGYTEADCSYKEKQQTAAFFLQTVFGLVGAGDFYTGNDGIGAGKVVLCSVSSILAGAARADKKSVAYIIGSLGVSASLVWWIVDIIRFGRNQINDGHGKPLESW